MPVSSYSPFSQPLATIACLYELTYSRHSIVNGIHMWSFVSSIPFSNVSTIIHVAACFSSSLIFMDNLLYGYTTFYYPFIS